MTANEIIQSVAGIATATGVGIGAAQIWIGRRQERKSALQERAAFEQQFVERYRHVVARIPLKFLLDSGVYDADDEKARRAFYDYFELCEDELFQNSQSETIYRERGQNGRVAFERTSADRPFVGDGTTCRRLPVSNSMSSGTGSRCTGRAEG